MIEKYEFKYMQVSSGKILQIERGPDSKCSGLLEENLGFVFLGKRFLLCLQLYSKC